ncbi:MAG: CoA-binding protein [Promethearchaeota archaeon]
MKQIDYFEKLFYPKSVAFIGATNKRTWHLKGILHRNFQGKVYLVSKSSGEIFGKKCFKDISQIPDGIDHTIIAVNRNILVDIVKECVKKKFFTLHIFTAGTGEFDEKGREIEDQLYKIISNSSTRVIGPNCMGVYSTGGRISYSPYFKADPVGNVAFVSQSGDLTDRFIETLNDLNVYFSTAASIGNSISLNVSDFIEYFNSDEKTDIISVYFEGFSKYREFEGKRLLEVLKKNKKPLIMLRSGITDQGKRSVKSHTGSLTTDNQIWDAVFAQTNAIQVRTLEELIDTTHAFAFCKDILPDVKGIILISWSGGCATVATDNITQIGVEVPEIRDPARSKMKEMIKIGSISNPLDLPWVSGTDTYLKIIKMAADEPYIGGVFLESFAASDEWDRGKDYFKTLQTLKNYCNQLGKPLFISLPYANIIKREELKKKLLQMGIPIFPSFESAAKSFLNLYNFQKSLQNNNINQNYSSMKLK